jgi:hypothetical protein
MGRLTVAALIGAMTIGAAGQAIAESAGEGKTKAKCEIAEVNPVTGFVGCIRPLGAPVAAPPAEAAAPCNPDQARGQWTWGPSCNELNSDVKGM